MARMRFNLRTLGRRCFERHRAAQLNLIIQEAAHDRVADRMSEAYYKDCTRIGGLIASLAPERPSARAP